MKYVNYNANPQRCHVGDCVIRAISTAFNEPWEYIYLKLCIEGLIMSDLPSANRVWGEYLRYQGLERNIPSEPQNVAYFVDSHAEGTYILSLPSHAVCVKNGVLYDTWDSRNEEVLYYWEVK